MSNLRPSLLLQRTFSLGLPNWRRLLTASVTALVACACASRRTVPEDFDPTPRPFVALPDEDPASIGFFLTQYDMSLLQWSELKMAASSTRDRRSLEALERSLEKRARERQAEILRELENGPPVNKRVAAVALGFTHDAGMLGPLLGGLSDSDPEVVQKSLLGLGVLGQPETPLAAIRARLLRDENPWTRNNAAFALLCLAQAGNRGPELVEASRDGCLDAEAGVRAQCASALGVSGDEEAVSILAGLLHDESNLAALAAAAALARIGLAAPEAKGAAARALADAMEQVRSDRRRHLMGALRMLAGKDMGEDAEPWQEWARRMP